MRRRTGGWCAALVTAFVLSVAFGGAAGGYVGAQTVPPRGGTLRAGLLFLDGLEHFYGKLPPGYDYLLDPQLSYNAVSWELFRCCLLRTLLSYNGHPTAQGGAELHPDLAASMPEISQDRLTWTFRLKRGLHYAPPFASTEIRAQDIVRALERDLTPSPRVARQIGSYLGSYRFYYVDVIAGAQEYAQGKADTISGLETPDDHTLVVHLLVPAGDLGYRLALPAAAPIPPSSRDPGARLGAAQGHDAGFGRFLVASGPYMIAGSQRLDFSLPANRQKPVSGYIWRRAATGLVRAKSLTLVRNPSWDPRSDALRKAYVDRIELSFGGTPAADAAAVDKGALDLVFDASATVDQVHRYLADARLKKRVFVYPSDWFFYMPMNVALPPFDDVHVRRAVNWAIDKAGLVRLANSKRFFFGGPLYGTVATHIAPDSMENDLLHDYDPYATPAHQGDLQAARRELARSRYDRKHDGICHARACKNLLLLTSRGSAALPAMAALVRKNLKRIGIELRIKVIPRVFFDYGHDAPPRDKVALLIGTQFPPDYPNGSTLFLPSFSGPELAFGKVGNAVPNLSLLGATPEQLRRWGYPVTSVPSVDDRINSCLPLVGLAQIECWATLDQYLMEKVVPWVPYLLVRYAYTVSARVRNFTWDQSALEIAALDQIAVGPTR